MSYQSALEAAGAKILRFEQFGSYQGEWVALVEYKGETGWVMGSYGSCSECDAFESEFGWDAEEQDDYQDHLKSFGEGYLNGLMTTEKTATYFDESAEWDAESESAASSVRYAGNLFGVK